MPVVQGYILTNVRDTYVHHIVKIFDEAHIKQKIKKNILA